MSKWEEYYCTIIIQSKSFECKSLLHQTDIYIKKKNYYAILTVLLYVENYTLAQKCKQNKNRQKRNKSELGGGGGEGESVRKIS